jgi:hypothetical protein
VVDIRLTEGGQGGRVVEMAGCEGLSSLMPLLHRVNSNSIL